MMQKKLPIYILLAFLIVVNGFFLFNYLGSGEKEEPTKERKPPGAFLKDQLGFDATQEETFDALSRAHRHEMRTILEDIRGLKDALFVGLSEPSTTRAGIDSIATRIGEKEKQRELLTYNHFKDIQNICNAEQKVMFSKIIKDALRPSGREHGPPRGGRPDGDRRPGPREGNGHGPPHRFKHE
ncbi:periplasmic heavy metal sensor [Cognatitamlana onchidii]|uniref:periplasmic heavy metal sensor n=1 Tax=Cognatitamlana onchidii TaxID=2562860 RepID=UPI001455F680|nr:periplasmic heavy metal sensor [Algibacter onchidii]